MVITVITMLDFDFGLRVVVAGDSGRSDGDGNDNDEPGDDQQVT